LLTDEVQIGVNGSFHGRARLVVTDAGGKSYH